MPFKLGQKPSNPVQKAQSNLPGGIMNKYSPEYLAASSPDASSIVGTTPEQKAQYGREHIPKPPSDPYGAKKFKATPQSEREIEGKKNIKVMSESELFNQQFYKGYGGITTGAANIALGSGEEGEVAGGFVPGVGEVIDAKNTIKDLKKGDYAGAAMNAAGFMLPFVGGKAIKKLFGKVDGPVPAPKPMPTSNPIKEIKQQANDRFAKGPRKYGNEPIDGYSISENELNAMKQQGKDLDENFGYFDYSDITHENAKFHGVKNGRPIAEVELPNGKTQMMYKSSGLANKAGDGVGGTTEGLWQPYGGHANMPNAAFGITDGGVNKDWFIKDGGYKDYYGSKSFKNLSGQMDRLAQDGKWDMSQMIQASKNK